MHRSNDEFYSISVEDSKLKIEFLFNHACFYLSVPFFYHQYRFPIVKNDIRQVFYRQGFRNFSSNVSLLFFSH